MKNIIIKVLEKYRGRPHSNEYIAEQIEEAIKVNQNECRFKWVQEQNSITLAIRAAKQRESVPKSNITSHG
jgi:hypothetical protein